MKRNKLSRLLLVLTVLAMIAALVSCKGNKDQNSDTSADSYVERTEYTITFESNGGSKVPSITVYKNAQLANFEPPVRDDYIFIGWTHEGRAWEFGEGGDYVKSDMTLYANWAKLNSVFKYEEIDGEIILTKLINKNDYPSLTIPERFNGKPVVGIGDEVFKNISINIDDSLFKGLKSVTFPKSVTKVGFAAFQDCSNLEITFKGELTSIGENAFYNCNTLRSINLSDELEKIPFRAFSKCQLESIIIPDSVKVIDENAFELSTYIRTAVIPADVKIEDSAFRDCVLLKSVFFRGTETQFGELSISGNNDPFKAAKVYYYSESEDVEADKFWQFDSKGTPTIIG
ncbi:MAG: leucine-rich repeat protein [Clostridia bacterium]|nr:leucine-rich repeat protein [Clostridia bacterium]